MYKEKMNYIPSDQLIPSPPVWRHCLFLFLFSAYRADAHWRLLLFHQFVWHPVHTCKHRFFKKNSTVLWSKINSDAPKNVRCAYKDKNLQIRDIFPGQNGAISIYHENPRKQWVTPNQSCPQFTQPLELTTGRSWQGRRYSSSFQASIQGFGSALI